MRYVSPVLLCLLALLPGCGGSADTSTPTATATNSQPTSENAEESIEGFGEEAEGSDREELLFVFHRYLGAIAAGDEEKACSHLGEQVGESLDQLAKAKNAGCPETLEALLSPEAAKLARSQERGRIEKVRLEGSTAFVVFHAPGARLYQLNLAREDDEWRVSALSASVLAPELPAREPG
jgi:hypothetical protein